MSLLATAVSATTSTGNLALDGLLGRFPGTLPMRQEEVVTIDFINRFLETHGSRGESQGVRAVAVEVRDIQTVSSNCNNLVIEVQWSPANSMPDTLFLKLPCAELATRWFCNVIGVWDLECEFFRRFAEDFPVRLPIVYGIASHRSRFVLMQENLHADADVELFVNSDMLAGPSPKRIETCLSTLARIHAFYNDWPASDRERRLALSRHPFRAPRMSGISRFLNLRAVTPCRRKAPELFPSETASLYRLAMKHWGALLEWWYRGPLTLVHGDSHLGNFFVDGEQMGMLDFQAVHWGKGMRDVQYFLINSVPSETLADCEAELVQYYVMQLEAHGVKLSFTDAWEQYRAYSFQTLMTIVVSFGLGPLTEKSAVLEEILRRSVAAVDRLEFSGWLNETILE